MAKEKNINPAKEYFSRIRGICKREKVLENEYLELISRIDSAQSSSIDFSRIIETRQSFTVTEGLFSIPTIYSKRLPASCKDPTAEIVEAYMEKAGELVAAIKRGTQAREQAGKFLECLSPEQEALFRAYYFNNMTWPDVAILLDYSVRTVFLKHRKALLELNNNYANVFQKELKTLNPEVRH